MYISHSAKSRFKSCPRSYYYHYKAKLRSPRLQSSLFFGNALDEGLSALLLQKKKELTEEEKEQLKVPAEDVFHSFMLKAKNDLGELVEIPQSNGVDYFGSDFDADLLTQGHISLVQQAAQDLQVQKSFSAIKTVADFHEDVKKNLSWRNKNRRKLEENEIKLYNYITWLSLNEKGKLMLQAYKDEIFPHIDEVIAIQKHVSIKNDVDDEIGGKIDFTASFKSCPGQTFIMDNKSASELYSDDSVTTSEQLATYAFAEENENAGYAVIQKKVFKKAPKIRTQLLLGKVSEETIKKTLDEFADTMDNITAAGDDIENYPCNFDSCFNYGRKCCYYSLCKYGKIEGLQTKS